MANVEEDLVTDSVPDPPRPQQSPDDNSNNGSADEAEVAQEKASASEEKQRRHSSSKPRRSFGIPNINTPGGGSMICINNASNVHVGNSININFVGQAFSQSPHRTSKSPSPEPCNSKKPKDVKDACKSTAHVTVEDLDTVTEHIGRRWMKLGERLGYTEEQMERFQEDHNDLGLKEVVYQMLLDWKQFKGPHAQVGILCHCLWSSHLYTAAEQLAALHSGKAP